MKLEGIRVIDLSQFLPGPHLTMLMADHGAEVIKIEPPGQGEPVRNLGYRAGGESVWFRNTHRGKKSAVLDLKTAEGMARWANSYVTPISDEEFQKILRVEYGGMQESLFNLYGITGKKEYADLGIETFILSGYPHLEEAYRFAELVFPLLKLRSANVTPLRANTGPFGETIAGEHRPLQKASQS